MSNDTVIFQKAFEPLNAGYWPRVGFRLAKNGKLVRNENLASLTVHPNGYGKKDWLMVQASLPKIVYGHNVTLPDERQAREAASWLCDYVSSETGLDFRIDGVKAFRIDYTQDYDIAEDKARPIALALLAKDIPKYIPKSERDSVCFEREQDGKVVRQIEIYPKFTWAGDTNQPQHVIDAARGKLRLEVRFIRKGLDSIKGANKPLDYLSQSINDAVLNEAEHLLDLQRVIDARQIDFHEKLIVHACGQRSLGKLGLPTFIELVKRYGPKFYREPDFHYPKSTFHERKKDVKRLGMWDELVAAYEANCSYE